MAGAFLALIVVVIVVVSAVTLIQNWGAPGPSG